MSLAVLAELHAYYEISFQNLVILSTMYNNWVDETLQTCKRMSIFKEKTIYKWMNEYNFERYYINLNHLQCTIKDSIKSWIMTWYHNADDRIEIEKFAWKDAGNLIAAISYLRKLNIRILSVKALTCLYFGPFLYFLEIFLVCAHTITHPCTHIHSP